MFLTVTGLGHSGVTLAVAFAKMGHTVVGFDIDSHLVASLNRGEIPYHSKRMKKDILMLKENNLLSFYDEMPSSSREAEMHWVCVSTPEGIVDEGSDVKNVVAATDILVNVVEKNSVVVYCSTVPVGTTHSMYSHLFQRLNFSVDFNVAFFPMFLTPDDSVDYFFAAKEHIVGADNEFTRKLFDKLFETNLKASLTFVDVNAAEFIKLTHSGLLATKLAYFNAVADFAYKAGVNMSPVVKFLAQELKNDSSSNVVETGFGGGDFIRSLKALSANAESYHNDLMPDFVKLVEKTNMKRLNSAFERVKYVLEGDVAGKKVLLLGAASKPETDDVDYSPAVLLASLLHNSGADVTIHDPACVDKVKNLQPYFKTVKTLKSAQKLTDVDVIIVGCFWKEYQKIVPQDFNSTVKSLKMFDLTGQVNHIKWLTAGWDVETMGSINNL